jgi:hypothetical protein
LHIACLLRRRIHASFRCSATVRGSHLLAQRPQLVHDFAVHRHGIAIGLDRYRRGAKKRLFDTKTLAMDRHLKIPQPSMHASVVDRGVLTPGSRAERVVLQQMTRTPSVNHERRAFTDYQR